MPNTERRHISLFEDCIFQSFPPSEKFSFSCGDEDLDGFFRNDAENYASQLLSKTYCFSLKDKPDVVVCAFTVSNDGIRREHLTNNARRRVAKNIPFLKASKLCTFPAVLIGRLGVSKDFVRSGIGSELLKFLKIWFSSSDNKTGCRFLIVDAYVEKTDFYQANDFFFVFKNEKEEETLSGHSPLRTRHMAYDLFNAAAPMKRTVSATEKNRGLAK